MFINTDPSNVPSMSPYGKKNRPFTEVDKSGSDTVIGKGLTLPDLIRSYYGTSDISAVDANYSFLDRDNKEREYNAVREDPFVFKSNGSIHEFHREAQLLMRDLISMWKEMGLPTKHDTDRGIELPDSDVILDNFGSATPLGKLIDKYKSDIIFILSNADIGKKFCVVRQVIPGWWASSYAGKDAPDLAHFAPSIKIHVQAMNKLKQTPKFRDVFEGLKQSVGDPLDTNVGYPFFSAEFDRMGIPTAKLKVLKLFKGLGMCDYDAGKLFKEVGTRARTLFPEKYPFAIAPIRRSQYGYKYAHVFHRTSTGLVTSHDLRGPNTTRIAWAVPYLYNLYMSPLQMEWKAVRMMMPGLYHDGESRKRRLATLRDKKPLMVEADYSNYDRFMPVNMFLAFVAEYVKHTKHPQFWFDMCKSMHFSMPLIWPDYIGDLQHRGWVFKPGKLGLLSGVKITSEEGTFINSIVNIQSLLDAGVLTQAQALDYLCQYASKETGSGNEYYYVQSDDTLLIHNDVTVLKKMTAAFVANAKRAGIKGEAMLGDRFLMRHMTKGCDSPVPFRVWQNTLQNEQGVTEPIKFAVGLAVRTDGLLGFKTFDPFSTGRIQSVSTSERFITMRVLESLKKFISSAHSPIPQALEVINALLDAGTSMTQHNDGSWRVSSDKASRLDGLRKDLLAVLAKYELSLLGDISNVDGTKLIKSVIYELHKNINVPSSALLLDQILSARPDLANLLDHVKGKENAFYKYALSELNIRVEV